MRWCSRSVGPAGAVCCACCATCGNAAGGPPAERSAELQPASRGASAATSAAQGASFDPHPARFARRPRIKSGAGSPPCRGRYTASASVAAATCGLRAFLFAAFTMLPSAFGDLDLLGPHRLDARPVALLHKAAHPHAQIGKPAGVYSGSDEIALIAFQDRHREGL